MSRHLLVSTMALATALATALEGPALAQAAAPPVVLPSDQAILKPAAEGTAAPRPAAPAAARPAPTRIDLTAALVRQAKGWRERGRKDLAYDSLRRAVQVSPNNAEAVYLLAQFSAQDGNTEAANGWLTRLRGLVKPGDGRIAQVEQALNRGQGSTSLARASDSLFPPRAAPATVGAEPGATAAPDPVLPRAAGQADLLLPRTTGAGGKATVTCKCPRFGDRSWRAGPGCRLHRIECGPDPRGGNPVRTGPGCPCGRQ
jgi:hypothetical protein